ncbi:M20/M25/M40 family metallo-hydrolase [Endozoicomonas ascidiicola]|uniref:M20/M25/M40 family metallo-hydrolase n=1 Tax=Endozoicomonas ascidiicola TaxID=1698521 RepID=UPI000834D1BC|nr:M20/M25/M40 family metallo-hydrolase [Endozoicomonas ascidiicola]
MYKRSLLVAVISGLSLLSLLSSVQATTHSPMVENLSQAIRYQTVSHQNLDAIDYDVFLDFHRFLENTYPLVHQHLKKTVIADYSLVYIWEGKDSSIPPVLFDAHYDVVPIEPGTEEDWQHDPFAGVVAEGYLWGRGALDDKASVISTFEAVESLLVDDYEPERTLVFSFGHDEEIGGNDGAANIASYLKKQGYDFEYVVGEGGLVVNGHPLLPGNPVAMIGLAEKNYVTLTLKASGDGGHSSMPVKNNAIVNLSKALTTLHEKPFKARLVKPVADMLKEMGEHIGGINGFMMRNQWLSKPILLSVMGDEKTSQSMVRTTTAVTMVNAGIKENVISQTAEAKVNFRLLPGTSVEQLISDVKALIDDETIEIVAKGWKKGPPIADMTAPGYGHLKTAINKVLPETVVVPGMLTATTDSPHYAPVSDNIYRFHPFTLHMKLVGSIHGTNERISVDSINTALELSKSLIRSSGNPGK